MPRARIRRIPLRRRDDTIVAYTLVDSRWYEWLAQWAWRLGSDRDHYAKRHQRIDGKFWNIYMAREILGLENGDPREAEHINRHSLDNREDNLRIAERGQLDNNQNASIRSDYARERVNLDMRKKRKEIEAEITAAEDQLIAETDDTQKTYLFGVINALTWVRGDMQGKRPTDKIQSGEMV